MSDKDYKYDSMVLSGNVKIGKCKVNYSGEYSLEFTMNGVTNLDNKQLLRLAAGGDGEDVDVDAVATMRLMFTHINLANKCNELTRELNQLKRVLKEIKEY